MFTATVFCRYAFLAALSITHITHAAALAPSAAAAQFGLTTSTLLPFPSATQSVNNTKKHLVAQWGLPKGRVDFGAENIAFVDDPYPDSNPPGSVSSSSSVMQVTYPKDSYSHGTGGAQFFSQWGTNGSDAFNSMMLSYELAFEAGFNWVKGGKLPGLRGGSAAGCSGGNQSNGTDCFTSRLMWRENGVGEIYAYIPTSDALCASSAVGCNADYGSSLSRGAFNFSSGQWTRVTQLIQLNNPPTAANGQIHLFMDDVLVAHQKNLIIRTNSSVAANGMYFSTFFGGSNTSWATPVTTHVYFRNIQLWGGSASAGVAHQTPAALSLTLLTVAVAVLSYA